MQLFDRLEEIDHDLLLSVNGLSDNGLIDHLMIFMSDKWVWLPLYAILTVLIWKRVGATSLVYLLVAVFSLLVLTDQGSVVFFKETFKRYRPCHHEELKALLTLPKGTCGGQFGFISSHASNVFGLATFLFVIMRSYSKLWILLFLWAGMIAVSRVFLAVHYPSDVVAGALFGVCCGFTISAIFKKSILLR